MKDINELKTLLNLEPEQRVGEQMGNYRLIRWLGRGAFADVYLGDHLYLKRQSAIKILHMHLPEKATKDFLNEARTIAGLEHPHIMHVLDYGVENRTPFLVMAYAPNGSLRQRFPEGTQVPLEQIVSLVQQIASALDYAHQQGVIHRDIKPENILIGAQDQILLSDFGLALAVQSMHSQATKAMAGTVLYMAPEMLEGKVHFASDQYALGIMTYEWLCGQCPFTSSYIQVATQHVLTPPPSLCERVPSLPPSVEHVVLKALAKDRTQRYENATAFANALQDACKDASSTGANMSTGQSLSSLSEALPMPEEPSTSSGPVRSTQPSRARGNSWQIVLVLLTLVVVIVSSVGLWYHITSWRVPTSHTAAASGKHQLTSTATSTATSTPSPTAIPTIIPKALPMITPTVAASPTAAPIPANANPYPPYSGKLVLSDPLRDNSRGYGWEDFAPNSGGASCQFIGGRYHSAESQSSYHACHASLQVSNFTLEVQMQIISGNCGGLVLRDTMIQAHAYGFEVCQNGSYALYRLDGLSAGWTRLTSSTSPAIHTGLSQSNVIAAVANGSSFDLYINQQKIASVNDSSYSQGQFGLSADGNTEAVYTNAKVWTL